MFDPVRRRAPDRYTIRLSQDERDAVGTFADQLRRLLTLEDPSSDAAVARIFPAAVPDDVVANLEYERRRSPGLLLGKLEALDTLETTLAAPELSGEQLAAWLDAINTIRLVVGTRLDIREDSTQGDFEGDERSEGLFEMYRYLTWLEGSIIEALDEEG